LARSESETYGNTPNPQQRQPRMAKAVFTTKSNPGYDDLPEERYHFPGTYLRQVEAAIGDWIVYYEPRRSSDSLSSRGGRQAYFATARLDKVTPDPAQQNHFYAQVSQFLPFDNAVPFRQSGHYFEAQLRRDDGGTSKGAFGRAVRSLSDAEFDLIVQAGFGPLLQTETQPSPYGPGFEEPASYDRPVVERLVARPFRDAAFSVAVKSAYDATCAISGLKIINGGGRSEVQAAHIRPVAEHGTDSVRNGIALCSTVHWMFDRGLISIDDDHSVLIAPNRVPDTVLRLINPDRHLRLPARLDQRPHPQFLRYHRDQVFKG
jgi:putative restriction endonuclease